MGGWEDGRMGGWEDGRMGGERMRGGEEGYTVLRFEYQLYCSLLQN